MLVFTDRESQDGANALKNVFGSGKIDQLRYLLHLRCLTYSENVFDKKYLTGSYRGQDLNTPDVLSRRVNLGATRDLEGPVRLKPNAPQSAVVINDRGRNVPNQLDFLDTSHDVSKTKGSLELHTPTTKKEITRRRQSMQQDPVPSRRETRSKTAISKNLPYTPVNEELTCRVLEYPINAVKNKITIFNDDH